jgi:D-sedoheptulose 7-phosphate isomerase
LARPRRLAHNPGVIDETHVRSVVAESLALKQRFFADNASLLVSIGRLAAQRMSAGGKLLAFGNGGSAADAQHLVGELVGRYRRERRGLPALALTTDPSVVTAIGNDLGWENVFRRQVEAHGRPGDVAVGISTSGRSPNVVEALRFARGLGLLTIGLTGQGGGRVREVVDHLIDVPHEETARIQEVHGMIVHLLCEIIEDEAARP